MTIQISTARRNAWGTADESTMGTSIKVRFYTGSPPANCAAAASGTQLGEITAQSDWQAAASGGEAAMQGTLSTTASATGTIGYYRFWDNAGTTCHEQGTVTKAFSLTTSSSTAANSNVLTFTATTGVTVGMAVSGTGVPTGATVLATTSTTVTLSAPSTAGVSSSTTILFGDTAGDMYLPETAVTSGITTISLTSATAVYPGA
jgi:hypothetical protein